MKIRLYCLLLFFCASGIGEAFAQTSEISLHLSPSFNALQPGAYTITINDEDRIQFLPTEKYRLDGSIFFNADDPGFKTKTPNRYAMTFAILNSKKKNVCTGSHSYWAVDAKNLHQEIAVTCRTYHGKVHIQDTKEEHIKNVSFQLYKEGELSPVYVLRNLFKFYPLGLQLNKVNNFIRPLPTSKTHEKK